ncbi:hypothetical protein L1049_027813 [Liquidambar formosana]|uniref:R13L1/DRL21-like LRR repeat region domain-containing protein n=1 Tax=Liquidambar formosana TaxID=63359 RepID=A0AAP0RIQ5_LIQFO
MRFPDWIGDHSFHSMTYLCLSNCKYCFSLPPLGQLPCLKYLSIVGLNGVEMVGLEFYGDCSFTIKPFQSLEILRFEEMLELVGWFCLEDEGGSFPCLRELYIKNCPKLAGSLPGNLPYLKRLLISDCQQLVASLPRTSAIRVLDLINCDKVVLRSNNELTSHPFVHVPEISNVTHQPPTQMMTLPNLVGLEQLSSIEILEGSGSSELKELPPWPHWLTIRGCEALESLPKGMRSINSCLLDLEISDCPRLKSFPKGGLPTTLRTLHIENCSELELLPRGETLNDYYASLESLSVNRSCDSLKFFPLGLFQKLNHLRISNCKNLESLSNPDRNLKSLSMLKIWGCPKLVSFPIGGLTTPNLTFIWLFSCNNLTSLPERMQDL